MVVVTLRLIRNFEYHSIKVVPYKAANLSLTVSEFLEELKRNLTTMLGVPPPFRTHRYDTLKISHQAHGFKANDIVINTDDDASLILVPKDTLADAGVKNETELSVFIRADYEKYKCNPSVKW